ncbi:MAG: GIY-YIG nuclease family protein [Candidatus Aenigmarchaeota archaeon]|nr:GIY-YIG nuclease family protein [Candidatus Aenigmarchaeota archaeon]
MKGSYILVISVKKPIEKKIGSLGFISFSPGIYLYVGSAMNGIEQRVSRHLRKKKKKFWHIDYLLDDRNVEVIEVLYKESKKKEECIISRKISEFGIPINGFGSSDCKCKGHLYRIKNIKKLKDIKGLQKLRDVFT